MERDQPGPPDDAGEQCGDVRVADYRTRVAGERLEVHAVEDASDAVPAAEAPDGVDRVVAKGAVQIGQAILVGPGEIAVVTGGVRRNDGFVIQRTAEQLGAGYIISFQQGSGRRHERNSTAAREPRRADERF